MVPVRRTLTLKVRASSSTGPPDTDNLKLKCVGKAPRARTPAPWLMVLEAFLTTPSSRSTAQTSSGEWAGWTVTVAEPKASAAGV